MNRKWRVILLIALALLAGAGGFGAYKYSQRGIVTVQTGRVLRQDLASVVTAPGEIKPLKYINIGANAMGRIIALYVQEGDRVKKNQVVARLESVQAEADVAAQKAAVSTALAESAAAEAALRSADENVQAAEASVARARADLERVRTTFEREQKLWQEKLIAQQQYDQRRAEYQAAQATAKEAEARLEQVRAQRQQAAAQLAAAQRRVAQVQALLRRAADVLDKYNVYSPIDGMVTNLPVRIGETVVPGIQNSPASTIMTIADMSLITAEVRVDETDIVNVRLNQPAEIRIDAMPNRVFRGHVIEIGNTAILRSTGLAASQSNVSTQEAKDFKVVIAMQDPPEDIRPGLSCTGRITTATRRQVLTIPLQALTARTKADLEQGPENGDRYVPPSQREELVGVFVIKGEQAEFRPVQTGIMGATEAEVLSGLSENEEIITGSYKVIRSLRNKARVKIDNKSDNKT